MPCFFGEEGNGGRAGIARRMSGWSDGSRRTLLARRSDGTGRRSEDEAIADEGKALLRKFGLNKLIVGAEE